MWNEGQKGSDRRNERGNENEKQKQEKDGRVMNGKKEVE